MVDAVLLAALILWDHSLRDTVPCTLRRDDAMVTQWTFICHDMFLVGFLCIGSICLPYQLGGSHHSKLKTESKTHKKRGWCCRLMFLTLLFDGNDEITDDSCHPWRLKAVTE